MTYFPVILLTKILNGILRRQSVYDNIKRLPSKYCYNFFIFLSFVISVSQPCDLEFLLVFLFSLFFYPIFCFSYMLVRPLCYSSLTLLKIHAKSCLSFAPLSTSSLSHWCLFQLVIALAVSVKSHLSCDAAAS